MRKTLTTATAIVLFATSPVLAGGMAEPIMEPEVIVEETAAGTAGGWIVPLVLIALVAAVVSASGSSDSPVAPIIPPDIPVPVLQ
jgi:hypothetical protein